MASSGTRFETYLANTLEAYRVKNLLYMEKVEPPIKTMYGGKRVIHLKNPFLDFIGTWTERGGKMIMVECKLTSEPLLKIGTNGIKTAQLTNGLKWEQMGAAVAYLWQFEDQTRLVTPRMVASQLKTRNSLRLCDAHPVSQGQGFVLIDFLALLRRIHKPQTPSTLTP